MPDQTGESPGEAERNPLFMKKIISFALASLMLTTVACSKTNEPGTTVRIPETPAEQSVQNMERAMALVDRAIACYFEGAGMTMSRSYNPFMGTRSDEKASVWMYGASIEAVNAILRGLKTQQREGIPQLYDQHFQRYTELLAQLYENADYYAGTYTLTSFTQTRKWTVYGVNRGGDKGSAQVEGILNVYDDQHWLIREFIEAYKLTGDNTYLEKAEYLTEYVLDGWDCTLDAAGNENGGIPWGPGYTTKHSCSNGPLISPLVWLYEIYKEKDDVTTHRFIDIDKSRKSETVRKSRYYLDFAKKIYDWQKSTLLRADGVYHDMRGGCDNCAVVYETVDGVRYRANTPLTRSEGQAHSYNCGSMLSGAADLYRVTRLSEYLDDFQRLSDVSFSYFGKLNQNVSGYYTYSVLGFSNWFNNVMMRGWVDGHKFYPSVSAPLASFQANLDYGWSHFLRDGLLPTNLLVGWNQDRGKNNVEGQFIFAFAAEYATLARYELEK